MKFISLLQKRIVLIHLLESLSSVKFTREDGCAGVSLPNGVLRKQESGQVMGIIWNVDALCTGQHDCESVGIFLTRMHELH